MHDVVIIGSGMGALCCAYILAKEGKKVCVLEKNRQIGGSLQIYSRDKSVFETGVHYIGGLSEGQSLNAYFKYLGLMNDLKLQKLDEDAYDVISFKGDDALYPHAQGYDNFVEQLAKFFPHEKEALKLYISKIREVADSFPLYNLNIDKNDISNAWFLTIDTQSYLASIFKDKKLQQVVAGSNILYAGEANQTPFYIHAIIVNSYIQSSYRCIDGSAQIATILGNHIKKMGGEIFNYSEASTFHFNGSEIASVELKNGVKIEGKLFISGIDISRTLEMIEGNHIRLAYRNRINGLENSTSSFLVNAVLKKDTMSHVNHNMYHFTQPNVWNGAHYTDDTWPNVVGFFTNTNSKNPQFTDNFTAFTYMKYSDCAKWEHTFSTIPHHKISRSVEYEDFKIQKSEKLLSALEERIPGIRSNIQSFTSASPLTYRDYIGSRDGTLYGIIKDYSDPLKSFITPRTKISNLFLTGQNLHLHGIMGVTLSAFVTCNEILGNTDLVRKVKSHL